MIFMRELYLLGTLVPIGLYGKIGWKCLCVASRLVDLRAALGVELRVFWQRRGYDDY
jgi:hypothetical protein